MQKSTPRKKRKTTRSKKQGSPIIYIIVGLLCVALIWLIIRDPHKPVNTEIKVADKTSTAQKPETKAAAEKPAKDETELDAAIRKAAGELGVPAKAVKRKDKDRLVRYRVPLDRNKVDLLFSNMIVKGRVEAAGGKLDKGKEASFKHLLNFSKSGLTQDYEVELYYDTDVYPKIEKTKNIAIVVDDFGEIKGELLDEFLAIDPNITIAIFPNMPYSNLTMLKAQERNMEALIHVPMEPIGYPAVNPGKDAILVQLSAAEIERRIDKFVKELPYCKGINNHMGSLATTERDVMQAVMNALKKHNKYFLDSRTSNVSIAYQVAQKSHIKAYQNQIFLDSPNTTDATMQAKFDQIIRLSNANPNVIAITHCHNQAKLEYLKTMVQRLKDAGFNLVKVSELSGQNLPPI